MTKAEHIIEDSNIPQLAAISTSTTLAKTVTTTIFVMPPQTIITTTVTTTTTITGPQTVTTPTLTETRSTSNDAATIPISAGILVAGAVISIALLKRRIRPS